MLQVTKGAAQTSSESEDNASLYDTLLIFLNLFKRQLPVFIVLIVFTTILGLLYLITTPASYTAMATMVIDTRKVQLFQQQTVVGDAAIDAGTVQTQIEILKSQNIALAVVKDLHLEDDPEFTGSSSGLIGTLLGNLMHFLGGADGVSETALQRRALGVFQSNRMITRVPNTYVMEISFTSHDAGKAGQIANAIADAYVVDQLDAKYQATRRASIWLQERIKELRTQASDAEKAVLDFKQSNNIVDAGGRLMSEQQLAEVNSQLIMAHAATAEAKARLDNINKIMKQPIPDASVADALKSEVIIKLRNQYLELASREALWIPKYGPNHLAVIALHNQMLELRHNISDEMAKIAQSYKSDYDVALARENAIQSSLDKTVSDSRVTGNAQIQMRELESNAQTYRGMYDNFLQRYMEAVQQQTFPITEARIISAATPGVKSAPKTIVVLAASIGSGLFLGFSIAFLRELVDRVFRMGSQVESKLQVRCLAIVPRVYRAGEKPPHSDSLAAKFGVFFASLNLGQVLSPPPIWEKKVGTVVSLPKAGEEDKRVDVSQAPGTREIHDTTDLSRHVIEAPFSQFAEALRSIKVAIDLSGSARANKVIGITSALPNEGKSTLAANLAQLIAHAGGRVLVVDGDLRNPSLTRHWAAAGEPGLIDILAGRGELEKVVWKDPESGLHFLPVGSVIKLIHTHEILGSQRTKLLFEHLRNDYDHIIVDLAPLAPVVDTRMTCNFIDSYVFAVEWGKTKIDVVEQSLAAANEVYDRLLGVVLNKTDMATIGRYEAHRSSYYYKKYYARYGYTS